MKSKTNETRQDRLANIGKTVLVFLLFASISVSAQNNYQQFSKELEAYRTSKDSVAKPAACTEYELKYIVRGKGFDEKVLPGDGRKLCDELKMAELSMTSAGGDGTAYDVKAIGNRYYSIRVDIPGGVQEFYYYQRRMRK